MKKLIALLLAFALCFALVGCGGTDKQAAIDAFNKASQSFDEVANEINANPEAYADEVITTLNEMADVMLEHKQLLESDQEISQEDLDAMMAWYVEVEEWVAEVKAELEAQ